MIHVCFNLRDESGTLSKFTGTAMVSLFENISKPFSYVTIHILHDNTLTADNRDKFSYLVGRYGQRVKFYNVEELFANRLEEIEKLFPNVDKTRFNKSLFYKFLIPQALSTDIEKVIYLESNIVVNMDISGLWRVELGDKMLAAVPALAIAPDIHTQDKIVADGFVKKEDYFSAGVLVMNLKLLRGETEKINDGLKFANGHNYFNLTDQTALNYCFATQAIKLPPDFNQFVRLARRNKESVAEKIYYYTAYALQLNMNDSFNRLWIEYFAKTPWFDAATIGKLYEGFQQVHNRLKKSMANLSVVMDGKARGFCTAPGYADELKKVFNVRSDEEIISLENQMSLRKLLDSMKKSQGKKLFFITAQNFPFNILTQSGFIYGKDFVNGLEFFSEEQGVLMNSYPLLRAM